MLTTSAPAEAQARVGAHAADWGGSVLVSGVDAGVDAEEGGKRGADARHVGGAVGGIRPGLQGVPPGQPELLARRRAVRSGPRVRVGPHGARAGHQRLRGRAELHAEKAVRLARAPLGALRAGAHRAGAQRPQPALRHRALLLHGRARGGAGAHPGSPRHPRVAPAQLVPRARRGRVLGAHGGDVGGRHRARGALARDPGAPALRTRRRCQNAAAEETPLEPQARLAAVSEDMCIPPYPRLAGDTL
mmetsp:Transcript_23519/g.76512  ORF Transcript_23519/g.76512 Transcript_23519/m.76512 type:complete len:246 (-) Transcript_23519:1089-1826(-)